VLTETVFSINGMGRLIITAINNQDYELVMGTTLFFGFTFVIGVILTDLSYAYIDPRVTYGERE
jgi:peptide/nickel transport system permease protein